MSPFVWCSKCERVFRHDREYDGNQVRQGEIGGYWCPFCNAFPLDTLDWESFIFGTAAANNYPDEPVDGCHYPLHPTI